MLKPGAVHRANGGYLVLHYNDVATKPGAWDGLKRVLQVPGKCAWKTRWSSTGCSSPQTLRPEPVPIDLKIIVTGDTLAYYMLSAYDDEAGRCSR